jgi:uncharacterized protein GlcG (DUF336 family)
MKTHRINAYLFALSNMALSIPVFAADVVQPPASTTANPSAQNRVPAAKGPALDLAIEAAKLAIETCRLDGGQKIGVSIIDAAGILKVLLAADGTSPRGVQSSTVKAATALTFKSATSALGEQAKTDANLSEKVTNNPAYNVRPGGILIKVGDEVIGAIGVGGGRTDEACAVAGLAKIQPQLNLAQY